MLAPCKGCIDRYKACHDPCDKYQAFRQERQEIYKQRLYAGEVAEIKYSNTQRMKKRRNEHDIVRIGRKNKGF